MPKRIKRRRQIRTGDGVDAGWEEFFDFIFPADQNTKGANKLLSAAMRWKMQMQKKDEEDNVEQQQVVPQMEEDRERLGLIRLLYQIFILLSGDSDTDIDDDSPLSENSSTSSSDST